MRRLGAADLSSLITSARGCLAWRPLRILRQVVVEAHPADLGRHEEVALRWQRIRVVERRERDTDPRCARPLGEQARAAGRAEDSPEFGRRRVPRGLPHHRYLIDRVERASEEGRAHPLLAQPAMADANVGRSPAHLEAHLAAQAAALAHDVVSHLDLLFQPSASALYVAAPRSGSPRRTTAAGSGGGHGAAFVVLSGRRETHFRYLWNTRCECRAGSKCTVVFADFVYGRLPKLHLRHV